MEMCPEHQTNPLATYGIHGDDECSDVPDIAPPIRVSTNFAYPSNPLALDPITLGLEDNSLIYSRENHPNAARLEKLLGSVVGGHAVVYSSGLSAFHAAMTLYNPKTVFVGSGYHGCHGILQMFTRNNGTKILPLESDPGLLQEGDLIHLETPVNPSGTARDIARFSRIAKERGAHLMVDATFAPPPLMDPFEFGADLVMHSATKYFGGHSDLLAGVLITRNREVKAKLLSDRVLLGTIISSLDSWLLLRSMRTFDLRIRKQLENVTKIVDYLVKHQSQLPKLKSVLHASLQTDEFVKTQLPLGGPPVFSMLVSDEATAKSIPSKLKYFHHCTSLGGIESIIEWRRMSDPAVDVRLLRVSVGGEDVDLLIEDLVQALK